MNVNDEWTDDERELMAALDTADADPGRWDAALKALLGRLDAYRPRIPRRACHSPVTMLMWVRAEPEQRKVMFTRQWFAEQERPASAARR